jgi:hypothetical protein
MGMTYAVIHGITTPNGTEEQIVEIFDDPQIALSHASELEKELSPEEREYQFFLVDELDNQNKMH